MLPALVAGVLDVPGFESLPPSASRIGVYALLLGGHLALVALAWRRYVVARRLREHAEAVAREADAAHQPFRRGATVLRGRWQPEDARATSPIVVRIVQRGRERQGKHGWYTYWTETERQVTTRPFVLRDVHGRTVRVEPGDTPLFADPLEPSATRLEGNQRERTARLDANEDVYVEGVLDPGTSDSPRGDVYRAADSEPVLRAAAGRRMLVSTEPLDTRYRQREGYNREWRMFAIVCTVVLPLALLAPYHLRVVAGHTVEAEVAARSIHYTRNKGRDVAHHVLDVRYPVGSNAHTYQEELDYGDWLHVDEGSRVWLDAAPIDAWSTLGLGHRAPVVTVSVGLVLLLILWIAYASLGPTAWYEKKRVVDVVNGRL